MSLLTVLAWPASAQETAQRYVPGDTVVATPAGRYDKGWFHELMLSSGHREVWSTPVRVEVLDLDRFAGGLRVVELGGGQQTRSLRLEGADGVNYAFRSIDKDVSRGIDPTLRRSIAARVLQDQIGSLLPTSALIVAPLLEAVGVLHAEPRLFVMPDDSRLGEFRAEFAGMLGFIEERPNEAEDGEPGFAGSTRVTGSERFLERLEEEDRNRIDARAYLEARMIDFLVGDWDRHPDQWRWAAFEDGDSTRWLPVPRDRDWALARMDGLLVKAAGIPFPGYIGLDDDLPSAYRLSWSGRALDRRLLAELPRSAFDSIARVVVSAVTDSVISNAVHRLPDAHYRIVGEELERSLRARRDELPAAANRYYLLLAGWVDVDLTDADETVIVERLPDGRVHVNALADDWQVFDRTFLPDETREVRLYLRGGDDELTVSGSASDAITIRVIGGGSDDRLSDTTSGDGVYFYDDRGVITIAPASGTSVDTTNWEDPDPSALDPPGARPRDWGSWWLPYPSFTIVPDVGLLVGAEAIRYGYGFRHLPWKTQLQLSFAVSTSGVVRAGARYEWPIMSRRMHGVVQVRGSALEVDRFYGFGNETSREGTDDTYHARRREFEAQFLAVYRPSADVSWGAGTVFRAHRSVEEEATLIDALSPYGYGDFEFAGLTAEGTFDTRDTPVAATRGVRLHVQMEHFPQVLDAAAEWTALSAQASVHATPPVLTRPTFALRVAGEHRSGRFPYGEAAYLGGPDDVRGFATRRFAGRSAAWTNAEARVPLSNVFVLLPMEVGVTALGDVGRVWMDDEESDVWHAAAGGGIWLSVLRRSNAASISLARSSEGVRVYVRGGFAF